MIQGQSAEFSNYSTPDVLLSMSLIFSVFITMVVVWQNLRVKNSIVAPIYLKG